MRRLYKSLYEDAPNTLSIAVDGETYNINTQDTVNLNRIYSDILSSSIFSRLRDRTGTLSLTIKISKVQFIDLITYLYQKNRKISYNRILDVVGDSFSNTEFKLLAKNRIERDNYWSKDYPMNFDIKFVGLANCDSRFDSTDYLKCTVHFHPNTSTRRHNAPGY